MQQKTEKFTGLYCAHCYQAIMGKALRVDNLYLDAYCYSLRYSIGLERPKGQFMSDRDENKHFQKRH